MINRTVIALTMISALGTGFVNASISIINHGAQPLKANFDYTQNNNTQTSPLFEIGPNSTIVWDAPGQGQACITALRINDMPRPLCNVTTSWPFNCTQEVLRCIEGVNIHIWPAGNATVDITKQTN